MRASFLQKFDVEITGEVAARGMNWSEKINSIVTTSNNLKGTFVKELRMASHGLASVITTLVRRTEISESVMELDDANRALRRMVEELKKEVSSLRDDNDGLRRRIRGDIPPPKETIAEATIQNMDKDGSGEKRGNVNGEKRHREDSEKNDGSTREDAMLEKISVMIRREIAREIAGLEDRLFSGRIVKPPLAADGKGIQSIPSTSKNGVGVMSRSEPEETLRKKPVIRSITDGTSTWAKVVGRRAAMTVEERKKIETVAVAEARRDIREDNTAR